MQRYLMMSIVLFFMQAGTLHAAEYQNVEVKKLLTATKTTTSGEKIRYLNSKNPEVTALTVRIPPGGSTGWHKHPVPVYAYVLEGRLTVALKDGRTFTFNKGDALVEVVNTFHNGTNSGPEPVTLAVFYTGAAGLQNVIKEEPAAAPAAP